MSMGKYECHNNIDPIYDDALSTTSFNIQEIHTMRDEKLDFLKTHPGQNLEGSYMEPRDFV